MILKLHLKIDRFTADHVLNAIAMRSQLHGPVITTIMILTVICSYDRIVGYVVQNQISVAGQPTFKAGIRFLQLLAEDEMAFDELYCIAFQLMDAQWLAKRASYMEFNVSPCFYLVHFFIQFFISIPMTKSNSLGISDRVESSRMF